MTVADYNIYRDRVLARTGNAKPQLIHRINCKLGVVGALVEHIARQPEDKPCGDDQQLLLKYTQEIAAEVGIYP